MNPKFVATAAVLILLSATLPAQDAKFVADNLKYSRDFYSNIHLVAIATLPRSFAYDRYPSAGPERIRCDDGTYARQHGKPWLKSDDWAETGKPVSKETAAKLDGWIKLIDAAMAVAPPEVKLAEKSEADGRTQWVFEAPSQNRNGSPMRLRFAKPLYDKSDDVLLHEFSGSFRLEGNKVVPAGAANPVKFSFGYLISVQGGYELSERAWEDLQTPKTEKNDSNPAQSSAAASAPEAAPKDAVAYNKRGNAKAMNGEVAGAIVDFNRAIELDPKLAAAYYNRGIARRVNRDLDGAIVDFNRAIELSPNEADVYNDRGIAKRAKGDVDGAIADYTHAIELAPKAAEFSYYNRAIARNGKSDLDGAMADYTRAIELNPKNANAYNNRANIKRGRKDFEGAIADFSSAIEINPKLAIAYKNRGETKQAKGDAAGATADLNHAAELDPQLGVKK